MIRSILLAATLALAACGPAPVVRVDSPRPVVDSAFLTDCEDLPKTPSPLTMGALLEHDGKVVGLYRECRKQNKAKANELKRLSAPASAPAAKAK